ncbi:MAG: DUF4114 domain-containing protein [Oscillatoriaceae cyanobacterium Prado104]|jgi:hypothetical protein|nr:DUF4114 domain-containing protein [Oscillatoriaceae cyanobacterium Prado104]
MSPISASTSSIATNISLIPDISENFQPETYSSNTSSPPQKNLLITDKITLRNSSSELLPPTAKTLDNSDEAQTKQAEIDSFILNPSPVTTNSSTAEKSPETSPTTDPITGDTAPPTTQNNFTFNSGTFQADATGKISIDYLSDGGGYQGELAIISLKGMEEFAPDSEAFIKEAARRALSNSSLDYIAISDITEAAKFSSFEGENNLNSGEYRGIKTFAMTPGDSIGIIVVPNGTIQEVYDNPAIGGDKKPLFSMATANSSDAFKPGQIAGVVNGGSIFVMEDMGIDAGSDADYNDIIFDLKGATPQVISLDDAIAENSDWRTSEKGKALIADAASKTETKLPEKTGGTTSPTNGEKFEEDKSQNIIAESETETETDSNFAVIDTQTQ